MVHSRRHINPRLRLAMIKMRYPIAVFNVAVVLLMRFFAADYVGSDLPLFFIFAITLTSIVGGLLPGILATLLSGAIGTYVFTPAIFSVVATSPSLHQVHLVAFLIEGLLVSVVCGQLLSAKNRMDASVEIFHTLFEFASVGVSQVDLRTGRIENANQKLCEITGYTLAELCELTPVQLAHPEDGQTNLQPFQDLLAGRTRQYVSETRILRKDGQGAWLRVNAQRLTSTADQSERIFNIVQDITAQKNSQEELVRAKEAAEASNLAKSTFLANMSHEIRTPLGAIMGFSELIADPLVTGSEKQCYHGAIQRNGELLANIISDILDLSKVDAGKMEVHVVPVALSEILNDTKTLLGLQASEKGVALKIQVDDNVPEIIRTDPLRLRQILSNVVGNAIKFTSKGSISVAVKRGRLDDHDRLLFVVEDTGMGIEKDQVGKLFTPFSQAFPGPVRSAGGTGLGLVLARRLANLLGGDVDLTQTEVNCGSTFAVSVDPGPILGITYVEARRGEQQNLRLQATPRLDGTKVLLADDAVDNQILVAHILKLAGATVDVASNGREAIERARLERYDVVLMDIQMPVMDGFEATAELRREGYGGKIIALTAFALSGEKQRCLDNGFDDHVSKPINRGVLIEGIRRLRPVSPGV